MIRLSDPTNLAHLLAAPVLAAMPSLSGKQAMSRVSVQGGPRRLTGCQMWSALSGLAVMLSSTHSQTL